MGQSLGRAILIMVLCAGELYVNLLMKGGPAHLSMQVQQGDRLRSVDGRPAGSMDLDVLQVRNAADAHCEFQQGRMESVSSSK